MSMDDGGRVQIPALSLNDQLATLSLPARSWGQGSNTSTLFPLGQARETLGAGRVGSHSNHANRSIPGRLEEQGGFILGKGHPGVAG